jgi:TolB protein
MKISSLLLLLVALGASALDTAKAAEDEHPGLHLFAMQADGTNVRRVVSLPEYPSVCSPEISPDGSKVAVDAWRSGEPSTAAHVLIVHLADDRVEDLGIGCMPSWSADGAAIAYCQYGKGVFIKTLDGKSDECLDPAGWAIQWSPDGKKLAYVKGGNFVIYDRASGERFEVFPEGESPYRAIYHNPTWSPDSKQLCFIGARDGRLELAIVAARKLMTTDFQVLRTADDLNPDLAWRPKVDEVLAVQKPIDGRPGQMLAVPVAKPIDGMEEMDETEDMEELAGKEAHAFPGQPVDRHNGGMSWSRDGAALYFMSAK